MSDEGWLGQLRRYRLELERRAAVAAPDDRARAEMLVDLAGQRIDDAVAAQQVAS